MKLSQLKKKIRKIILPLVFLCSMFALGLFFGLNSWDQNLYVQWSPTQGRGVAGLNSSTEILNLSSNQLIQKASSALFSQNQVVRDKNLMSFYLGNFLVHDSHLKKHRFICEIFPLVEFSFSALGIHFSGEEGLMIIQSPCNMKDENFIGPFWIPHQEILANPNRRSFEIPNQQTFIRFYHISTLMTSDWLLKSVRFFNENQKDQDLLIRFTPGTEKPYFELSLKNKGNIKETTL